MHFDDRLATVLRNRATGERACKTQFRQLIDLLGERPQAGDPALKAAAYLRLIALAETIGADERARIVGETGWRFRNPELVKWFGEAHPKVAAAALYRAKLSGEEWEVLIPKLPIRARGFLRHRRDLPEEAVRVLDRLGVQDRALPLPELAQTTAVERRDDADAGDLANDPAPFVLDTALDDESAAQEAPASRAPEAAPQIAPPPPREQQHAPRKSGREPEPNGIRALVDRIEAFKRTRGSSAGRGAPSLPLGELDPPQPREAIQNFLFGTDTQGRIDWADETVAPMIIGTMLGELECSDGAVADLGAAIRNRRPIGDGRVALQGGEAISGDWIVDATPCFTRDDGRFKGYVGRFRRIAPTQEGRRQEAADRLRQLLHELRTPVNAMQGNAEVIQQQIFGPTPHEYRALAATIAGDSARILAGFDELDRLARLETGSLELEEGSADFAAIARAQVAQLQTVLKPRVAQFETSLTTDAALLPLAQGEAEMLAWRILATLAGATGAGETIHLDLRTQDEQATLRARLPASLAREADVFSNEARAASGAVSAGIFGPGFSLRLARAEARAAGGELSRDGEWLVLSLPLLTGAQRLPSPADAPDRAAG